MKPNVKQPADWTDAQINAFWDWQSQQAANQQQYFTAVMAPAIVRFLKKKNLLRGKVLDYGCGAGHLLEVLLQEPGTACYGIDFSAESIERTKEKTKGHAGLKELVVADKLPLPLPGDYFSLVTMIETIEHLRDEQLSATFDEAFRLLKSGGALFITTPFAEALEAHMQYCPFCNSEFHRMQHLQSFSVERLQQLATEHGFTVNICGPLDMEMIRLGTFRYGLKKTLIGLAASAGLAEKRLHSTPNLLALLIKP